MQAKIVFAGSNNTSYEQAAAVAFWARREANESGQHRYRMAARLQTK